MKFLKYLERWEYHQPLSFWVFTLGLYFCFTTLFSSLTSSSENPSQARVVAEQVRCGGGDQRPNFSQKILTLFVPNPKPCPPKQNRQGALKFAPGSGSNPSGGDKNSGQGSQVVPHQSKKIDLVLHRRLEQNCPDWEDRMDYQKTQQHFYDLAINRKREIKRLRMIDNPKFYTKKELDAMNYFYGTGFYKQHQDPSVRPNIFDSRQSFVMKMHDEKMRDNFLNSFNHTNK